MKTVIVVLGLILGAYLTAAYVPDIDDIEELKARCNKKAGNGTYEKLKSARDDTTTCLENLVDVETFKKELEESKKRGEMDEVFDKYCKKRPQMRECIKKTLDALEPCLEQNEKDAINFTTNIIQQVGDFACFKEGDRLALFVAEGGVECINNRSQAIQKCLNETIKFNPDTFSLDSMPKLITDKNSACKNLDTIRSCIVTDLEEKCNDTTPANMMDALLKFIKKIVCKDVINSLVQS